MDGRTGGNSLVWAERLTKAFGPAGQQVFGLRDVSFGVARGEMLAVIGASGSGKSTLLHLIAGLTAPTAGAVVVDGHNLAEFTDRQLTLFRRRHVGLVFQAYNLVPTLNVVDNLQLPLLMERGGRVDKLHIEHLLETLGLRDRRRHRPDQLSGGEQQRVAIGRALVANPAVILADEPTGNLDSVNSRKFCELLRTLSVEQGRTIIVVTHDPAVAAWADRVLVLKDGRVAREIESANHLRAKELGAAFLDIMARREGEPCA